MVFTARWPGATAAEMQDQVAERIEKKLQELPHVDRVETYTRPGFVAVQLKLRDDTPPNEVPDLWYQARKKINDIKPTLPEGVLGPQADDEYGDVYSGVYYFTGDGLTPADLKRLAEDARHRFLRLPGVSKVVLVGDRPEKVFVEFSHAKLATLGVTPRQLFDSLAKQNAVTAAGSVDTAHDRVFVRVDGALDAADRVRDVPVEAGGKLFRLGDVAEVRRGYEDPPEFTVRHNGQAGGRAVGGDGPGRERDRPRQGAAGRVGEDQGRPAGRGGAARGRVPAARGRRVGRRVRPVVRRGPRDRARRSAS